MDKLDRFHSGTFDIISATCWRTEAGVWTPAAHWLNFDQQGHIGRSIWPLTPVRPLECKRLLQNIADTCDLKTSAHKQLGWNWMINPFRLIAPEIITQFIHTCHLCLFHLLWSTGISTVLCRKSPPPPPPPPPCIYNIQYFWLTRWGRVSHNCVK